MILRPARADDAPLLAAWDEKPHVKWCTGFDPDLPLPVDEREDWAGLIGREVDWLDILIGEVDGRAIGVVQIIDPHLEETTTGGDARPTSAPSISGSARKPIWAAVSARK